MIKDLVEVYDKVKAKYKRSPQETIWRITVESPAKSFYITKRLLKEILFDYKR